MSTATAKPLKTPSKPAENPAFTSLPVQDVAALFDLSVQAVHKWIDNGCPKNEERKKTAPGPGALSKTLNLYRVIPWRLRSDPEESIKAKIEHEKFRKFKLENDSKEGLLVDRAEMDATLRSRMRSLRNFFERGLPMNRTQRAMKTVDELASLDHEFVRSAMEAYFGGPGWVKEL